MSFKDLNLEYNYSSSKINIVEQFYNPVLSQAIKYDRITGYFNSTSLAIAARGLKNFIINKGKMRLLCGVILDEDDLNSILSASDLENIISENFLEDIENMEDKIKRNHIKLLAWMISNNLLEIKIGIKQVNGTYIGGILHMKNGIMYDNENNCILFNGSNNETASGWNNNIEKFKLFFSWENSQKYIEPDIIEFSEFWNNENNNLEVMDIPQAAKKGLIEIAPKSYEEFNKLILSYEESLFLDKSSIKNRELYPHQRNALNSWFDNNKKGIFEMATGTGKTFTALKCLEKSLSQEENLVTVIACPYAHLVEQWGNELEKFNIAPVYRLYGTGNSNWKKNLDSLVFKLNFKVKENAIILTTHSSFSKEIFISNLSKLHNPKLLIVDEMHHLSAESYKKGLDVNYNYLLGLSATPSIYMDEEATDYLSDLFGGIVYSFTIEDALNETNHNGETFLTHYNYYPERINLNDDELKEYVDLNKKIARLFHIKNKSKEIEDKLKILYMERKSIVNNAKNKLECLRTILRKWDNLDHLIIFCSPQQINDVLLILKEENITPRHKFTQEEGARKNKLYGNISQREDLLNKFDEGVYKVLVAIKCLDEGVDVPSADKVIIMSSSTNPREYVQRRGRVLRRYPGKNLAYIYDMVVIPDVEDNLDNLMESEKKRMLDFIPLADNGIEGINLLKKWRVFE